MNVVKAAQRTVNKGPEAWFTGDVSVEMLVAAEEPGRMSAGRVTFQPGARTAWHSHPHGQALVVTDGRGRAQQWGGSVREIEPGDVIYVTRKPQTFTALGSVIRQGELGIDREEFNLSQALGMMGGLNTVVADTTGVFLFREENPAVLRALRPQSQLLAKQMPLKVIYRLNFSDPSAYFLAAKMPVRQGDMVYVSNAPSVDFVKIVSVLRLVAQTTRSIQVADPNY